MRREHSRASALGDALHLLTLWSFALAQPLFDVLRRNGEFLIAHRVRLSDLLLLTLIVSLLIPAAIALATLVARVASKTVGRLIHLAWIATLSAAVASGALAWRFALPPAVHFVIVAGIGVAAAWAYAVVAPVRLFLTVLIPAVVLFPAIFLLHPDMAPFVRPRDAARSPVSVPKQSPPIVIVVFDQLPLTSLIKEDGRIDDLNFPGFAALAANATWYRNATAVADFTGWALPPIVTGQKPLRRRLPVAEHHPVNLFTLLAGRYRLEVFEPITRLCPEQLCASDRGTLPGRLRAVLPDLAIVYLHLVLPRELRQDLPELTADWRDFARGGDWRQRWRRSRDTDRTLAPRAFILGISRSDPQPTLYFLHALLPHEPYVYLRSGQQHSSGRRLVGLLGRGMWTQDEPPVIEAYRLHLLQLGYVDTLVSMLIERLEAEGLFDRALIVVTADHGASFRPGMPFKTVREETLGDIMPVPLLIKTPGQRQGRISDRNVETVDILTAVGESLGVRLPPAVAATAPSSATPERATKTIYRFAATERLTIDDRSLLELRTAAVKRKLDLFGRGANPVWVPVESAATSVIGRPVADFVSGDSQELRVLVDDAARFRAVDISARDVPALLTGRLVDRAGMPAHAELAIVIGGRVRAITSTYASGRLSGSWTAIVDPRSFRRGRNDVEVHVLHRRNGDVRLERAYTSSDRPDSLNLVSRAAVEHWAVALSGFATLGDSPWTTGDALIVVPLDQARPRSLRVGLVEGPVDAEPIRVTINDCVLYDGPVQAAPWYRTFSLSACPPSTLHRSEARIRLQSRTMNMGGERKRVGVKVENVLLLDRDWPIAAEDRESRAAIRIQNGPELTRERGTVLGAEIVNVGDGVLLSPDDSAQSGVHLELRWRGRGTARDGDIQRLGLTRTVYPNEKLVMQIPLMPPPRLEFRGPWDVHVVPVRDDGRPITLEAACVVRVMPSGGSEQPHRAR